MSLSKKIFFYILTLYFANLEVVSSEDDIPSVIIIGAGVAGIAAAAKLFQDGFKSVTILEAENSIGGRIHTIKFSKYFIIFLSSNDLNLLLYTILQRNT